MAGDIGIKELSLQISPKFTEEVVLSILKKATAKNDIDLVKCELTSGSTRSGDSYLSSLFRLKIEGKANGKLYPVAVIVKGLPKNIGRRKTFRSTDFFRNEVAFYNEVIPRFMEFQEKRKPKKPFQEIPHCYYALADGENDFVALEDLSVQGYEPADRKRGVDFDHCAYILQTLGRFHALSYAMKDQDPETFKTVANSVEETYWHADIKSWYAGQFKRFRDITMDSVSKEYPNSIYEEKVKKFADETLYDLLAELAKPKEPYAVIGHGDTWAPNFLFRYTGENEATIKGLKVIDFQLARYGSPILDFSFFLFSCVTPELRNTHYKELKKIYHQSLSEFLQDLGSSPDTLFPYEAFEKELLSYMQFGLGFSFESVIFSVMDESEVSDLDLIEGDEAVPLEKVWNVVPIKTKEDRLRLCDNIKFCIDNGYVK